MSRTHFDEFMARLGLDDRLQRDFRERFGAPEAGVAVGELADFAAARGYRFTAEELRGEIADAALDGVVGGVALNTSSLQPASLSFGSPSPLELFDKDAGALTLNVNGLFLKF